MRCTLLLKDGGGRSRKTFRDCILQNVRDAVLISRLCARNREPEHTIRSVLELDEQGQVVEGRRNSEQSVTFFKKGTILVLVASTLSLPDIWDFLGTVPRKICPTLN